MLSNKEILLFGAAFGPPHLGHLAMLEACLTLLNPEEIWLLPSYDHTFGKKLLAPQHRIAMCQLMINALPPQLQPKVILSTLEIDHQLNGDTCNTLDLLLKDPQHAQNHYSFLMGSDQLPRFKEWGRYEYLLEHMAFYVYLRAGFPLYPLLDNMYPLNGVTEVDISSTQVRQAVKTKQPISHLVLPEIETYISTHHLYQ